MSFRTKNVVEKRKLHNERLDPFVQTPLNLSTLSAKTLKNTFGVRLAHFQPTPSYTDRILMQDFKKLYEKACAECGDWRIVVRRLADEFAPEKVEQLCEMSTSARNKSTYTNSIHAPLRKTRHVMQPPVSLAESSSAMQRSTRRRVLVPVTGGLSSLACVWWALNRVDFDVYLCYLVGVDRADTERELTALVQLMRFARDSNGMPLVSRREHQMVIDIEHLRNDPDARIKFLPMPAQPYVLDSEKRLAHREISAKRRSMASLKHHPLTYALMYRQLLAAAQSMCCNDIVWGMYGTERSIIEALHSTFAQKVFSHQNWFPFDTRTAAYDAFCTAAHASDNVWRDSVEPLHQSEQNRDGRKVSAGGNSSSRSSSKSGKRKTKHSSNDKLNDNNCAPESRVMRTGGASLMPDAAQFVCTCAPSNGVEETLDEAVSKCTDKKKRKNKKQSPSSEESDESCDQYLKRRLKLIRALNWCGKCCDCSPWAEVAVAIHDADVNVHRSGTDRLVDNHSLIDAYTLLLQSGTEHPRSGNSVTRKRRVQKLRQGKKRQENKRKRMRKDTRSVFGDFLDPERQRRSREAVGLDPDRQQRSSTASVLDPERQRRSREALCLNQQRIGDDGEEEEEEEEEEDVEATALDVEELDALVESQDIDDDSSEDAEIVSSLSDGEEEDEEEDEEDDEEEEDEEDSDANEDDDVEDDDVEDDDDIIDSLNDADDGDDIAEDALCDYD